MQQMENRVKEIEQQIAHLRWKRMQNERSIQKSLVVTKTLRQKDAVVALSLDKSAERYLWTHSVVRDELQRPLVITDEELYKMQLDEDRSKKKLLKYANSHLNVINKISTDMSQHSPQGEVGKQLQVEKIAILQQIKRDVKSHIRSIEESSPVVDAKTAIPKLYH